MYRTYSYNDMPQPVRRRSEEHRDPPRCEMPERAEPSPPPEDKEKNEPTQPRSLLERIEADDLILVIVALVLLIDDCDDKLLLIAVAFIFFSEWF